MKIKSYIKEHTPKNVWKWMHNVRSFVPLIPYLYANRKAEKRVRKKKDPLNVLFFAMFDSQWKYDSLYQLMLKDENFNPLIIVCPCTIFNEEHMKKTMTQCCQFFAKKGYAFIRSYNEENNSYVDPYKYQPDIIFYTNPYPGHVDDRYYRDHFKDVLSCYVNYYYNTRLASLSFSFDFHKVLWRHYLEYSLLLKQINETYYPFKINGKVVGYPFFDAFRQYKASDYAWPIPGKRKKRIIWAPHHTIKGRDQWIALATFERYYDFMLKISEKYKEEIQIILKPHPLLKQNLYEAEEWGRERTDAYFEKWEKGENTALSEGEYIELFLSSDAMIHDSNSFQIEYLAVNKPTLFLNSGKTEEQMTEVAMKARSCHYNGDSENDIERFIQQVVLGGQDELKERRELFYSDYILPPNGKLAAENIINDLLNSLRRNSTKI